jgi:hypothetical protein
LEKFQKSIIRYDCHNPKLIFIALTHSFECDFVLFCFCFVEISLQRLKEALGVFLRAELYETTVLVAKQLVRIGERHRMYTDLSFYHQQMMVAYESINNAEFKGTRFLGTYYRVGFYGATAIPHLHGKEYIYKEPKLTKLGEITERLTKNVEKQSRVKNGGVKVLTESGKIDLSSLDPNIAYIQITRKSYATFQTAFHAFHISIFNKKNKCNLC